MNGEFVEKSFDELTDAENKKVHYDCVAKNIIKFALRRSPLICINCLE